MVAFSAAMNASVGILSSREHTQSRILFARIPFMSYALATASQRFPSNGMFGRMVFPRFVEFFVDGFPAEVDDVVS